MTAPEVVTLSATTVAASAATPPASDVAAFIQLIERVARDPSIDVDKLNRLLMMRERENARLAEQAFCAALAEAQTEMVPVVADSNNPQTRSRYASYAALDRAVRPIYTRHGFGLTFNTDDAPGLEQARVTCDVCHSGGHTRRYRIDMPVDGKGARGGDVMTKTHAVGSGVSYAMRYLLRMVFNLAVDHDDDGNAAGYRTRAVVSPPARALDAHTPTINANASPTDAHASPSDAEISGRRAAVQLRNALPQYVREPPQRKLQRELAKQRHTGNHYEAIIKSEQGREGRFRQPLPQKVDERNPPDDYREGGPGANGARKLDHSDRGGVPAFLDRRKPNGTEPTFGRPGIVRSSR
jgi:hypothetical protein